MVDNHDLVESDEIIESEDVVEQGLDLAAYVAEDPCF
jgi:hypothetical protein